MKNVFFMCFLLLGIALQAQPGHGPEEGRKARKEMRDQMKNLTPLQKAELKTKRMALHLDLSEAQQKEVQKILLEREEKFENLRNEKNKERELSKEELFERKSDMLDDQIAMKQQMKSILTEAQFAKFEKMKQKRQDKRKHFQKGRNR